MARSFWFLYWMKILVIGKLMMIWNKFKMEIKILSFGRLLWIKQKLFQLKSKVELQLVFDITYIFCTIAPTINVAVQKNAATLIVGAISYRNATGVVSSYITITHLKKIKKIVRGKQLGKLIFPPNYFFNFFIVQIFLLKRN